MSNVRLFPCRTSKVRMSLEITTFDSSSECSEESESKRLATRSQTWPKAASETPQLRGAMGLPELRASELCGRSPRTSMKSQRSKETANARDDGEGLHSGRVHLPRRRRSSEAQQEAERRPSKQQQKPQSIAARLPPPGPAGALTEDGQKFVPAKVAEHTYSPLSRRSTASSDSAPPSKNSASARETWPELLSPPKRSSAVSQHAKPTKEGPTQVFRTALRHFISDIGTSIAGSISTNEHPKELSTRVPSHLRDVGEEAIRVSKEDAYRRRKQDQIRQIPDMSARCAVSQQAPNEHRRRVVTDIGMAKGTLSMSVQSPDHAAKLGNCKSLPTWSTTTWTPRGGGALTSRRVQLQAPSRLYSSTGFVGM